jgi:organic hydroperoxide reductase OsmC/OhrA
MVEIAFAFSDIAGTEAALGWAGSHTLVADRPDGRAGGRGLGCNGGQLLALGGRFCNDLRYVAHERNVARGAIDNQARLDLPGERLVATRAETILTRDTEDGSDPAEVIDRARENGTVSNALTGDVPVGIKQGGQT